jgi:hypothetical protein
MKVQSIQTKRILLCGSFASNWESISIKLTATKEHLVDYGEHIRLCSYMVAKVIQPHTEHT